MHTHVHVCTGRLEGTGSCPYSAARLNSAGCTDYNPGNAATAVGIQRQHRTLPSKTFSPKSLRGLLEAPHDREIHSVSTELDANITDEVPSQQLGWELTNI